MNLFDHSLNVLIKMDDYEFVLMSNVFLHLSVKFDLLNLLIDNLNLQVIHIEHLQLVLMLKEHLNNELLDFFFYLKINKINLDHQMVVCQLNIDI
jgi:hypothetical protein